MKKFIISTLFLPAILCCAILFCHCGQKNGSQKIKLDNAAIREAQATAELSTTLQVEAEERRSIAVFYFANMSDDRELDWMRRGLLEMLVTDLSQSRYVDVVGEPMLSSLIRRMGIAENQSLNADLAISVAREAGLETVLVGNFRREGEKIYIDAQLHDARTKSLLKADQVECQGMERVFTMVDDLSQQIRNDLRPALKDVVEFDRDLADATTSSIEAFRYFAEGLEQLDKYFYEEAAGYFEKAIAVDSAFATAWARLGIAYDGLSRVREAIHAMNKASSLLDRVTERERLNIIALAAQFKGDARSAVQAYEDMAELFPRDKEAHFQLGNVYYLLRRYDDAIGSFEKAIEIDHTYIHPYNLLGYLYARKNDYDKGIETLRRYAELVPDEPNPHDSMAEILHMAGRFDEALQECKKALEMKSDFHFSWRRIGDIYLDTSEFGKARQAFQRYLEICPGANTKSNGFRFLGETHWAAGKPQNAIKLFQEGLKTNPDNFSLVILIASLLEAQGEKAEARKFQEEWFRSTEERILHEDNFEVVRSFVATCLYDTIHINDLDPYIDKMLDLAENDFNRALVDYYRGAVRLQQRKWAESLSFLEKSIPAYFSVEMQNGLRLEAIRNLALALSNGATSKEDVRTFQEQLITIARENDNPALEASARYSVLEYLNNLGDNDGLDRELKDAGTPRESDWQVIGPFPYGHGLHHRYPPERDMDPARQYKGAGGKVGWRSAQDGIQEGYIDLERVFEPDKWVMAYGALTCSSPTARQAQLRVGSNESMKLWLNGEEVLVRNLRREAVLDEDIIPVQLSQGTNTILIKVCQKVGPWGFFFRLTDEEGRGFEDVTFSPPTAS